MFTGIIKNFGEIAAIDFNENHDCLLAVFVHGEVEKKLEVGCSIACNGICLTLIKQQNHALYFQASQETCDVTTLKNWRVKQKINIEFALKMGDELGGHMVLGHVDGTAQLQKIEQIQDSRKMTFELTESSAALARFISKKGSICLDGVSLTVNDVAKDIFYVNIIAHSFENTTLGAIKIGDFVNVEIDTIARYVLNAQEYTKST